MEKTSEGIGGSMCSIIHAPVFCIRYTEGDTYNYQTLKVRHTLKFRKVKWNDQYSEKNIDVRPKAKELLKKYPWPAYKGLKDYEGVRKFTPAELIGQLREVAAGGVCPWGKAWQARFKRRKAKAA
jgi:hypothetical protein